jgi:hypothetical protein
MRTRQDGERRELFWVLVRDLPCEAATPIVANKMETSVAMPDSGYDIERIVDQSVHNDNWSDRPDRGERLRDIPVGSGLAWISHARAGQGGERGHHRAF